MIGFKWKWRRQDLIWVFICIILCLLFIIGSLLTILIKDKTGATEYFSFAVNISSIALAVIAIIYAFFQTRESSQQGTLTQQALYKIREEVIKLSNIKDDIVTLRSDWGTQSNSFKEQIEEVKQIANSLKDVTEQPSENNDSINPEIKTKVNELIDKVDDIEKRNKAESYKRSIVKKRADAIRELALDPRFGNAELTNREFAKYMNKREWDKIKKESEESEKRYCEIHRLMREND